MLFAKTPQAAPKDARTRRSALRAVVFLVLAVLCAVGTAVIFTRYMDARTAALRVPTDRVVVAAVDIPVASPIQAEWLAVVEWPRVSRPTGAQEDPVPLVGRVAHTPITKGEAILPTKLASISGKSGLAALLPPGARAVSVRVDDVVGVAGFVHPGDHVDVVVTIQARNDGPFASKVILQNVKVLAVGQDLEHRGREAEKASPATVATLQVSPEQSEVLALAASRGKLLLSLRSASDTEVAATRGIVPSGLLANGLVDALPAPAPAPAAVPAKTRPARSVARAAAAPARQAQVVEILRGDLFEKRDFDKAEKRP